MPSMSSDRRKAEKSERPLDRRRRFGAAEGRSVCDSGGRGGILRHPEQALDGNEKVDVAVLGQFRGDVAVVDERGPDGDAARKPEGGDLAAHFVLEGRRNALLVQGKNWAAIRKNQNSRPRI